MIIGTSPKLFWVSRQKVKNASCAKRQMFPSAHVKIAQWNVSCYAINSSIISEFLWIITGSYRYSKSLRKGSGLATPIINQGALS